MGVAIVQCPRILGIHPLLGVVGSQTRYHVDPILQKFESGAAQPKHARTDTH
jgi:hypothetical protein